MKSSTTFQYLLYVTLATKLVSEAFTLSPSHGISVSISPVPSSALSAKKKRKKRKKQPESSSQDLPDFDLDTDDGALPDFDLGAEDEPVKPAAKKAAATTELSFDEISDNMMGDASTPTASLKDLITDRSLESNFVFDAAEEDKSIPDFVDFARPSDPEPPAPGSKAERREQRKAAAIARIEAEQESKLDIPFITDENGEISALKVLEAGAWVGIFLLVGWEVYLNSPFFDRAAPMAPVVFENP